MFTKALRHLNIARKETTLINIDPGNVNTNLFLHAWGRVGIEVTKATETFELATSEIYSDPGGDPKYYFKLNTRDPAK